MEKGYLTGEGGVWGPGVKVLDDEGRAGNDVVGGDVGSGGSGGDDDVRDTLETSGDLCHVVLVKLNGGGTDTVVEDGVLDSGTLSAVVESEGGGLSWHTVLDGQSTEGLDGESGIGLGARGDEGRGDGVDHVKTKSGVVSRRPWLVHADGR